MLLEFTIQELLSPLLQERRFATESKGNFYCGFPQSTQASGGTTPSRT
jgi:hypothetical protein